MKVEEERDTDQRTQLRPLVRVITTFCYLLSSHQPNSFSPKHYNVSRVLHREQLAHNVALMNMIYTVSHLLFKYLNNAVACPLW